jgi:very-short-patch-repair endonuclease
MKRIANPITTTDLCSYGCGLVATFINGSNRLMCCKSSNSCPENKRKNSLGVKNSERDYAEIYKNLPQESKDRMNWSKGLTKDIDARVARPQFEGRRWGASLNGQTVESKLKIAKARTEWLKKADNRKNLGRHKKSWMEITFESYLNENDITGWETEVHFWNDELRKNYFPDFIFENKKMIIELDGTQHRKTVVQDSIRDKWFNSKGYTVIRITHPEFKERYFSRKGFLDLLRG